MSALKNNGNTLEHFGEVVNLMKLEASQSDKIPVQGEHGTVHFVDRKCARNNETGAKKNPPTYSAVDTSFADLETKAEKLFQIWKDPFSYKDFKVYLAMREAHQRQEEVEKAKMCSHFGVRYASRVMLSNDDPFMGHPVAERELEFIIPGHECELHVNMSLE